MEIIWQSGKIVRNINKGCLGHWNMINKRTNSGYLENSIENNKNRRKNSAYCLEKSVNKGFFLA
jgi:hypothetical protein